MISRFLTKIFGTANERMLKKLWPMVAHIASLEPRFQNMSDEELAGMTNKFREQLSQGKTLDDIMPEAFAVAREAAQRQVGMRPYDVQIMGAIVLHQGRIAEMKTGEGKTLTSSLALYLNALEGKGAHAVTVNDYLAKRDAEWNAPIYNFLGLEVQALTNDLPDSKRKEAYNADILYATNNELGFDYLRDNMKFRYSDYVQRPLHYAIIDECDSILIDEARTPLIISGPAQRSSELYTISQKVVYDFQRDVEYEHDEKARSVQLTEKGHDKIEQRLRLKNLYAVENINVLHHVMQALKANVMFKRDVDYVVHEGQVLIVDEFTGRILQGRRYSDGLHQAIEAKEGVKIEQETQTLASITLQNFFRMYNKMAGMTGTAATEAEEFRKIYDLDVVQIPTNKPLIRDDQQDIIFLTERAKFKQIVHDVKQAYEKGQPVLIGTVAIEKSEALSEALSAAGVPHEVLNAKNHSREAEIITHAGEPGKITIATNMAGRGTDIKLTDEAKEAGGLFVLGTERHESRRIDNQLRGRSGRQGDPGRSRFYISLEDDLIRVFSGDTMKRNMERFGMTEDQNITDPMITRMIANSQEKVEKYNFEIRKHLLEYDDVLNQHRKIVYDLRQQILQNEENIVGLVKDFIGAFLSNLVSYHSVNRGITNSNVAAMFDVLDNITTISKEEFSKADLSTANADAFLSDLHNFIVMNYELRRKQAEEKLIANAEKWLMLETIDQAWKQHMINIDHLKEGIGLRGVGQKNPLIEYKKEAFAMFEDMVKQVRADVVGHIFHLNPEQFNAQALEQRREQELAAMQFTGASESAAGGAINEAVSGKQQQSKQDDEFSGMSRAERRRAMRGKGKNR